MGYKFRREATLEEISVKLNRLMLLGLFELVIGVLAVVAGILAPSTVLLGGYAVLQLLGCLIGIVAIVVGVLTVANAIGIPLGIIADVLTVPFQLQLVTYLATVKGILCILCLMWVFGAFTWTSFLFYVFAIVVDFGLAFYGRQIINWILARAPPKILKFKI